MGWKKSNALRKRKKTSKDTKNEIQEVIRDIMSDFIF